MRTDDNLMPFIESEVVDGTLIIGTRPHTDLAPSDGVTYRVACEQVSELRLSGSGEIEVTACPVSDLTVRLDGSGDVQVDGVDATRVDAEIGGSGTISAIGQSSQVRASIVGSGMFVGAELQAREVEAMIPGSGQIIVWATGALHVDISGSGSVLYRGEPDVTQEISGPGAVTAEKRRMSSGACPRGDRSAASGATRARFGWVDPVIVVQCLPTGAGQGDRPARDGVIGSATSCAGVGGDDAVVRM